MAMDGKHGGLLGVSPSLHLDLSCFWASLRIEETSLDWIGIGLDQLKRNEKKIYAPMDKNQLRNTSSHRID